MKAELEKLYEHIDDIEIAMMTTRRPDGHLQSRAMATQKHADGADLWFVTLEGGQKLRDIAADPHINLSYYKDRPREWVSVSGIASITRDRQKIQELYAPDWKAWFPKEGDPRHGSADDPRMVTAHPRPCTSATNSTPSRRAISCPLAVRSRRIEQSPNHAEALGIASSSMRPPRSRPTLEAARSTSAETCFLDGDESPLAFSAHEND